MVKGGKRARTREKLIEATLAVIAERGFAGASLDEIAARAGVTTGSVYSNFRGKAELVWAAASRRSLRLAPELAPGASLREHARAVAHAVMAILPQARADGAFHRDLQLYVRTDPDLSARQTQQYAELFDEIAAQLEAAHGDELVIPPRSLALGIQALIWGFIAQWTQTPDEVTEPVVAAAFEALAVGASRPSAGAK